MEPPRAPKRFNSGKFDLLTALPAHTALQKHVTPFTLPEGFTRTGNGCVRLGREASLLCGRSAIKPHLSGFATIRPEAPPLAEFRERSNRRGGHGLDCERARHPRLAFVNSRLVIKRFSRGWFIVGNGFQGDV